MKVQPCGHRVWPMASSGLTSSSHIRLGPICPVQVMNAQNRGAKGVLIYSDPEDDGTGKGDVYPQGPWRPEFSVQVRQYVTKAIERLLFSQEAVERVVRPPFGKFLLTFS